MATVESVTLKLKNGGTLVLQGGKHVVKKSFDMWPFMMFLTVGLMIAKLTGHFPHSWWIVFAPIWEPPAIGIGVLLAVVGLIICVLLPVAIVIGCIFGIAAIIDWRNNRKRRKRAMTVLGR